MDTLQENMKSFFARYKHGWILLYLPIYLVWFAYLEKMVTKNFHIIHMKIDDYIPFIEYFIVPYLLWFAYVAAAVIYFFFANINDYYRLCIFLFVGMTVFLVISTIYPNGHYLRPSVFQRDNIFVALVQWLYRIDTPTNILPSIHVYNSVCVHIAVSRSEKLRQNKTVWFGSMILMGSIVLSTIFLKQHSVFDIITGIVMAVLMYTVVYGRDYQKSRQKVYEEQYHQI